MADEPNTQSDQTGAANKPDPWTEGKPAPKAGARRKAGWEQQVISRLAGAALVEQRRARRWGIFFKSLGFAYIGFSLFLVWQAMDFGKPKQAAGRHTAVVEVDGVISAGEKASAEQVIAGLHAAYDDSRTAGIILRINSPGGSPVQAGEIYDEIRRLREQKPDIPVYAVLGDICASGGYYVAAAADRIYADKASIVGSIGVRMDGFGFVDTMAKLGVERRLLTAGENKGLLDPFSPSNETEVAHMQTLLDDIHQQFIDAVRSGRGDRLANDATLFSGLIWTGVQAREKGLVDALGSARHVAREVIGAAELVNFTPHENLVDRFAERIGATLVQLLGTSSQPVLRP